MQSKNKQTNCNNTRGNLTDFSFLSRHHCTKSKNYLKRRNQIRHYISMFLGHPVCKVVKLSMQCCGQILQNSFETYKTLRG